MEFIEINVTEAVPQIDLKGPFAGVALDVGTIVYHKINPGVSYEDTLDEMNMERARYLLNTDEILEEKFGQIQA